MPCLRPCARLGEFTHSAPEEPVATLAPPRCPHCNGYIRPGVVWFGEDLPRQEWRRAEEWVAQCDVLLVVGTSGIVYPAAELPALARRKGKWMAEINPTPSALSAKMNLYWQTTAASGLAHLMSALRDRCGDLDGFGDDRQT